MIATELVIELLKKTRDDTNARIMVDSGIPVPFEEAMEMHMGKGFLLLCDIRKKKMLTKCPFSGLWDIDCVYLEDEEHPGRCEIDVCPGNGDAWCHQRIDYAVFMEDGPESLEE